MKVAIIVVLIAMVGCANARSLIRDDLEEMQNMMMDRWHAEGLNVGEDEDQMPHKLQDFFDSWRISPQNEDGADYVGQQGSLETRQHEDEMPDKLQDFFDSWRISKADNGETK